ncbi:hypothetical protein [Oleispirillum naphthae]
MTAARRLHRAARVFRMLTPFGWSCLFVALCATCVIGVCAR